MSDGDSESKPQVDLAVLKRRVGRVIKDKWTLERLLGVGGMAAVYAAKHEIGRRDALKILHPHVAEDPDIVARFKREAKAANRFSHPGAVEVRDVDETDDGEPFLVMELLEGGSLARRIRKEGKVAPEEVLRIADELLDTLAVAHAEGVIHRDIKPSNVFIEPHGKVKLLDFGIARMAPRHGKQGTLVTDAGTTLGTVAYMPPEQLRSSDVDARADLYALGATLYRALSGERTHDYDDEAKLAQAILTKPARSLAEVLPDADADLVAVIDRALAGKPEQRYPDAATMQADVKALRDGEDPSFALAAADVGEGATELMVDQEATTAQRPAEEAEGADDGADEEDADFEGVEATVPMDAKEAPEESETAEEGESEASAEEAGEAPDPAAARPGKTEIAEEPSLGLSEEKAARRGAVAKTVVDASVADDADGADGEKAAEDDAGHRGDEPEGVAIGGTVGWVIAAAVVLTVAYVVYRANNDDLVEPPLPTSTAPLTLPAPGDGPAADGPSTDAPGAGGDAASGAGGAAMAGPDGDPTSQPGAQPGNQPGAQPGNQPGSQPDPKPGGLPGLPPLPSGFPTSLPTAIPSSFPKLPKDFPQVPSSFPKIPQPPAPPPPAPPRPAPPPPAPPPPPPPPPVPPPPAPAP